LGVVVWWSGGLRSLRQSALVSGSNLEKDLLEGVDRGRKPKRDLVLDWIPSLFPSFSWCSASKNLTLRKLAQHAQGRFMVCVSASTAMSGW
jgi:hypothetical protein